ncbi:MAG: Dam family site-specific DNA-(adenine-N6)-methyltransferase [Gammaproteobacteria bacterium]|nr:Dam family site-specific DNA-(adenine-N6)-methyltransferase [Gammaproteobacteria bacterium]
MKVRVPPIKSQGIKTKLVPWIKSIVPDEFNGKWIEPFSGTGVVGFNIAPEHALMCDTNPHIINFYSAVKDGKITPEIVRNYLNEEGSLLQEKGDIHYYEIRERFNEKHEPLDFLFINRAGFNGMIRFNRKGSFNIPFCKKSKRFSQAYVTKIVNQVHYVRQLLKLKDFTFKCQQFEKTVKLAEEDDIVYCDPPYIDRHVDYYSGWDSEHEQALFHVLNKKKCRFILSTWHHNDFRKNEYIESMWSKFNIYTREHFYHVGGSEKNRNPMIEAIVTNFDALTRTTCEQEKQEQFVLLQNQAVYRV